MTGFGGMERRGGSLIDVRENYYGRNFILKFPTAGGKTVKVVHNPFKFIGNRPEKMGEIGPSLMEASRAHIQMLGEMLGRLGTEEEKPLSGTGRAFGRKEARPCCGDLDAENQALFALAADLKNGSEARRIFSYARPDQGGKRAKEVELVDSGLRFESDVGVVALVVESWLEETLSSKDCCSKVEISYMPAEEVGRMMHEQMSMARRQAWAF